MAKHKHKQFLSSPFPSCFRPPTDQTRPSLPPPPTHFPGVTPSLTTCLYYTEIGVFGLTWYRDLLGRSLHLQLHQFVDNPEESFPPPSDHNLHHHPAHPPDSLANSLQFQLQIQPYALNFWKKKRGSKKLQLVGDRKIRSGVAASMIVYWDFSRAKFGARPEPLGGFYIAVVFDGELVLLVGDCPPPKQAVPLRAKSLSDHEPAAAQKLKQAMVLRREHVRVTGGNNSTDSIGKMASTKKKSLVYTTKAEFRGKETDVCIDCRINGGEDEGQASTLNFSVDHKRVLQIKHLEWKFRGNERIKVDGVPVQISWDVHNWLFNHNNHMDIDGRYALFTLKFEEEDDQEETSMLSTSTSDKDQSYDHEYNNNSFTINRGTSMERDGMRLGFEFETKKLMKKKAATAVAAGLLRSGRSSSSSSLSSASSSCSSVMEWASTEENELKGPSGFSLVVYAWKS